MRIKKSIIALVAIITTVYGNVFAQGEHMVRDVYMDAKITNLHYNPTSDAIEFTLKFKAGNGYIPRDNETGRWIGINLFFDLYIEPGVTLNLAPALDPEHPTPNDAQVRIAGNFGINNAAVQGGAANYPNHPGLTVATAPVGSTPFAATLSRTNTSQDLELEYVDVAYYYIPVTSAQKPTSNTRFVMRTYTKPQIPYYYIYNTSAWNNLASDIYSRFKSEKDSYPLQGPCPAEALWTGDFNSDWFDSDNWVNPNVSIAENGSLPALNAIPGGCTTVYIPGSGYRGEYLTANNPINNFPMLTTGTTPICKNIVFFQGGQLGRVDLLTYEKAKVQFSFPWEGVSEVRAKPHNHHTGGGDNPDFYSFAKGYSTPDLSFGSWHMLSIPLQGVVSGDLGYGGYPFTFMQKFDVAQSGTGRFENAYNEGGWSTPFTEVDEDFDPAEGLAFYAYSLADAAGYNITGYYKDEGDRAINAAYGIYRTSGIVELPSYDHNISLESRRIQSYNGTTSTFHIVDAGIYEGGELSPTFGQFTGTTHTKNRSNNDYRFIIEKDGTPDEFNYPVRTTESNYTLVGNPYMSALDFDEFADYNLGNANNGYNPVYYIWNGSGYDSYTVGGTSTGGLTRYIAPMQGFFIKSRRNSDGTTANVGFLAETMSTTTPSGTAAQLRSTSDIEKNIIRIGTQHGDKTNRTLIAQKENASIGFIEEEDVTKLFSSAKGYPDVPEVYTIVDDTPLSMNFINNVSATIPVGIRIPKSGFTTLTLTGMKNYNADKIEFVEILSEGAEKVTEITNWEGDFTLTFANDNSGYQTGRFFLRIAQSTTGFGDVIAEEAIQIYKERKAIQVVSSPNDKIKQVYVYDLQGRVLHSNTSVDTDIHQITGSFGSQVLLVKVVTENNTESVKLIMN